MNNKVSKITMLTALFIAGIVNAQEFYTCVPKKSWWNEMIKSNVPNTDNLTKAIAKEITNIQHQSQLKVLDLRITSPLKDFKGFLDPGKYRVRAAGAGGKEEV